MDQAYEWCDLVVCRSGAMTVSEVCCAGVVAIFVPYPYAVNDHQAANASYLVDQGAAYMVRQEQFLDGSWLEIVHRVMGHRELLVSMGSAARELAKPRASETVAQICMEAMDA
jgi:UDP-N-acetylglucosamine--N-acetylmuramyl-(pentapeptide) pyrophosphoryl-undecaprenol N-acetylglucosamine transferase